MDLFSIVLPIIYTLFGLGLVWFIIELVVTIRKVRGEALSVIKDVKPTLDNIETIVSDIQPAISKIDPLMDRVTLTIDSVNLEMIRVDEILETVTNITNSVNRTTNAIGNVTNAPADIITSVTSKIRNKISPRYSSNDVAAAGLIDGNANHNPIADFADATIDAASEAIREQHDKAAERRAHQQMAIDQLNQKNEDLANAAQKLSDSIIGQADADAATYAPDGQDEDQDQIDDANEGQAQLAQDAAIADHAENHQQPNDQQFGQPTEQAVEQQADRGPAQETDVHAPSMEANNEYGFDSEVSIEQFGDLEGFGEQDETSYEELQARGDDDVSDDDLPTPNFGEQSNDAAQGHVDTLDSLDFLDAQMVLDAQPVMTDEPIAEDPIAAEPVWPEAPVEVEAAGEPEAPAKKRSLRKSGYFEIPSEPVEPQAIEQDAFYEAMGEAQLSEEEIDALITQEAIHEVFGDRLLSGEMTEEDIAAIEQMMREASLADASPVAAQFAEPNVADPMIAVEAAGYDEPAEQAAYAFASEGIAGNPRFMRVASASHSGSVRATASNMSAVDVTAVDPAATGSTTTFLISSEGEAGESGGIPISEIKIG